MRELRVGRPSREAYELDPDLGPEGELLVERATAARRLAARLNERASGGAPTAHAGEIVALGLLHEVGHALVDRYERDVKPALFDDALRDLDERIGTKPVEDVLARFAKEFGPEPGRGDLLESLLLLDIAADNPAAMPIHPLVDPGPVAKAKAYARVTAAIESLLGDAEAPDGSGESLVGMLRALGRDPARGPRGAAARRGGPPRGGGARAPPPVRRRRWRRAGGGSVVRRR